MTATTGFRNGRVHVLVVDEPALTDVLSVAVEEAGRRACPALDGQSALRIARGRPPHAVVPDGMLPDLDGLQVLRRLRPENPELPVLMLTARDALEHRLDGLGAGADGYVTKPCSVAEVVVRLRGLLDLLLLARLDEGRPLQSTEVDMAALVAEAVWDARAAGDGHDWQLELRLDAPAPVLGDEARLHQVVANLLANARVHTPEGTTVVASVGPTPTAA
jgi:two-component system OmpR family response regulator